jgi:hypothetical protein
MTDRTAPERIWVAPMHEAKHDDDFYLLGPKYRNGRGTEYIRADLHRAEADALVGAAYEDAASEVGEHLSTPEDVVWAKDAAERILDHTPADARAALRAREEAAVRRALEAAINVVSGCDRVSHVQPAIRALDPAKIVSEP